MPVLLISTLDTPRFCRNRVRTLCLPWDALDWYSRNAALTARRTVRADSFVVEIIMLNVFCSISSCNFTTIPCRLHQRSHEEAAECAELKKCETDEKIQHNTPQTMQMQGSF